MFTSSFLSTVIRKALRRGVWFSALDCLERGILRLASRLVDRVESEVLGAELVKILSKLRKAMTSGFTRRLLEAGFKQARMCATQAEKWGYCDAEAWASDVSFARYLTLLDFNGPSGRGV